MNDLLNKTVRIVFNQSSSLNGGVLGIVCRIIGFAEGFAIALDRNNVEAYYSLSCIKSITLIEEQSEALKCL